MMQKLRTALTQTFLSFSVMNSLVEALMKLDFKIGEEKINEMQLAFSNLAAWPFYLISLLIYFDPTVYTWSLQKWLAVNPDVAFFLLDGRIGTMVLFAFGFFVIQWFTQSETILLSLVLYFLNKSDIHFHLALSGIAAIIFARCCFQFRLRSGLKSKTFQLWTNSSMLQLAGWFLGAVLSFYFLNVLSQQQYFASSVKENRFAFSILMVTSTYFFQFALSASWSHFYFNATKESLAPSDFPINYSSANWLQRRNLRPELRLKLSQQTTKYLELHQKNLDELSAIKDLGPVSIPRQISEILEIELQHLKLASSRLTSE